MPPFRSTEFASTGHRGGEGEKEEEEKLLDKKKEAAKEIANQAAILPTDVNVKTEPRD